MRGYVSLVSVRECVLTTLMGYVGKDLVGMMYPNTRIIQVSVRVSRECVNDIDGMCVRGSGRYDVPEYSNNSGEC